MTTAKTRDRSSTYTPGSDQPRRATWLTRAMQPQEILGWITLLGLVLSILGFRFISLSSIDERVGKLERREEMRDYILCVMVRRTDPNASPPGCDPIIERGRRP